MQNNYNANNTIWDGNMNVVQPRKYTNKMSKAEIRMLKWMCGNTINIGLQRKIYVHSE